MQKIFKTKNEYKSERRVKIKIDVISVKPDNFEIFKNSNFVMLCLKDVIGVNKKKIGKIYDAIVNIQDLSIQGFLVYESKWESILASFGHRKSQVTSITPNTINKITDSSIYLNINKDELPKFRMHEDTRSNEILLSILKKSSVVDLSGIRVGSIKNFYYDKDGQLSYELGGKQLAPYLKQKLVSSKLSYLVQNQAFTHIKTNDNTSRVFEINCNFKDLEKNIKLFLPNILQMLKKIAKVYGKKNDKTKFIIENISKGLDQYFEHLNENLKNSNINDKVINELEVIKEHILKRALVDAASDNKITAGERILISKIASYLNDHRVEFFWNNFSYHKNLIKIKSLL